MTPNEAPPDDSPVVDRGYRNDTDRGAAILVGTVLALALFVLLLAVWQGVLIPAEVRGAEIDHSEAVVGDLADIRSEARSVAQRDHERTVAVELEPAYPRYRTLIGPPPASAELRTGESESVTIENAEGVGPVSRYWTGAERSVPTRPLIYRPSYNEYDDAPRTVLGVDGVTNVFEGADEPITQQRAASDLIDGTRINLLALSGEYEETRGPRTAVDLSPVSSPQRTVTVRGTETGDEPDPIVIEVPTELSGDTWRDVLAEERSDGIVESVTDTGDGSVRIELAGSFRYELRMAQVGVGDEPGSPGPAYVLPVDEGGGLLNGEATVEVRDRFNNPVSGARVNVSDGDGAPTDVCDDVDDGYVWTDEEGRASVRCSIEDERLVTLSIGDDEPYEWVRFRRGVPLSDEDPPYVERFDFDGESVERAYVTDVGTTNLYQSTVTYEVGDLQGLDRARIEFLDGSGNVVTAETVDVGGLEDEGYVTTPWLRSGIDEARIVVADREGNYDVATVGVTQGPRGSITGTVTDSETGDPIEGATVGIQSQYGIGSTTTGPDGTYTFADLRPGEYEITTSATGYRSSDPVTVTVDSTGNDEVLDIALDPVDEDLESSLSGTVTNAATGDGLDGVTVTATSSTETYTAITASDGTYTIESIEPGTYTVVADGSPEYSIETVENVEIGSGEDVVQNFQLQPADGSISGTVRTSADTPISGVTVMVRDPTTGNAIGSVVTGSDGTYSIPVPGDRTYDVIADGTAVQYTTETITGVTVGPGQARTGIDFTLDSTGQGGTVELTGAVSVVSGTGGSRMSFTLTNSGTTGATITAIRVPSTTNPNALSVRGQTTSPNRNNPTFNVAGGNNVPGTMRIIIGADTDTPLATGAEIPAGATRTFELGQFLTSTTETSGRQNMQGDSITVTFVFDDGSRQTVTLNP